MSTILTRDSISVFHVIDIVSTTRYYKLQASSASPPVKPETATPSGWTTTEPTYTEGSTDSLYTVEKTVFSDGTFEYSDVSLSSSYEAAKTAYNKSVQAKNTADAALADAVEYVIGTQTAKTGSWTGVTRDVSLTAGKTIAYKLPYAGDGEATLTLTLAGGGTTEAVPVYLNTTRVTTHFGAGSVINMTYDGTSWRASSIPNTNTNNYDRRLHNSAIKAAAAVTEAHLIAGTADGYKNLAASLAFDLAYPILYASKSISANKTAKTTYEAMPDVNFSTTGTIESGTAAKILWLKGTVTGNTFTIAATNWLTTVVPATDDGMYYIPLGVMSSATAGYFATSNRLYAYLNGAFQPVDTAAKLMAEEASQVATNYVTDITGGGVFVHPEGEGPDETNTPTGWKIADALELIKSGVTHFKVWVDNSVTKVRVGRADAGHTDIDSNGMRVFGGTGSEQLANIGYGDGNAQGGGTAAKPYFTFGTRFIASGEQVGNLSVAEGNDTEARGYASHSEGLQTQAIGDMSHAEGEGGVASGESSHAEGLNGTASGTAAHKEGSGGTASGLASHTEGVGCTASAQAAHAGGTSSMASGQGSFAHGENVRATGAGSAAVGEYNAYSNQYAFAVGNGDASTRKNAFTVGKSGNAYVAGRMMCGTMEDGTTSKAMFVKGSASKTSASVASNGTLRVPIDITKDGYIPMAIAGVQLTSSSFTYYAATIVTTTNPTGDTYDAVLYVKNNGSAAATTGINLIIFYIAESAL